MYPSSSSMSFLECTCNSDPPRKGLISALYSHLLESPNATPFSYVTKWERDLGTTLDLTEWIHIWQATKSSSLNIAALETHYKVLTRWYLIPARNAKYVLQYYPLLLPWLYCCRHAPTHLVGLPHHPGLFFLHFLTLQCLQTVL